MKTLVCTSIGINRDVARFWLEGQKLDFAFEQGQKLKYSIDKKSKILVIEVSNEGTHTVSFRKRTQKPLVEIKDNEFGVVFGIGTDLRVAISKGRMVVSIQPNVIKQQVRVQEMIERVQKGEPLRKGSVFTGGAVMDGAFYESFEALNLEAYNKFAIEIESKYVDVFCKNQPHLFREDSYIINSSVEMLDYANTPKVDVLTAGLPCTASTSAWRVGAGYQKGTGVDKACAESHTTAGAAFIYLLSIISASNPGVIVLEQKTLKRP